MNNQISFGSTLIFNDTNYGNPKKYPINLLNEKQRIMLSALASKTGPKEDIMVISSATDETAFRNYHRIMAKLFSHNPKTQTGSLKIFEEQTNALVKTNLQKRIFQLAVDTILDAKKNLKKL